MYSPQINDNYFILCSSLYSLVHIRPPLTSISSSTLKNVLSLCGDAEALECFSIEIIRSSWAGGVISELKKNSFSPKAGTKSSNQTAWGSNFAKKGRRTQDGLRACKN